MKIIESTDDYEVQNFDIFDDELEACACLCGLSSGSGAGTKTEKIKEIKN